jgi:hypothetical protein
MELDRVSIYVCTGYSVFPFFNGRGRLLDSKKIKKV